MTDFKEIMRAAPKGRLRLTCTLDLVVEVVASNHLCIRHL